MGSAECDEWKMALQGEESEPVRAHSPLVVDFEHDDDLGRDQERDQLINKTRQPTPVPRHPVLDPLLVPQENRR